jgi:hypothetical protein
VREEVEGVLLEMVPGVEDGWRRWTQCRQVVEDVDEELSRNHEGSHASELGAQQVDIVPRRLTSEIEPTLSPSLHLSGDVGEVAHVDPLVGHGTTLQERLAKISRESALHG